MTWQFEKGYEDKKIVNPETVDLKLLKTDRDVIMAYAELSKASHWRKDATKGNLAWQKEKQLVDEVRTRLESAGWHAHIFKSGSAECDCDRNLYLHALAGLPQVHQVPFSDKWNIELTENELFNEDGTLRRKHETLAMLRKRIGEEPLNLDALVNEDEITEETAQTVKAIMDEESLLEIHELDEENKTFRSGANSYTWRNTENEAKQEAREYLEDGELWRSAVEAKDTTLSLEDWIDLVLDVDGWAHVLCGYDGVSHELEDGKVYWRT